MIMMNFYDICVIGGGPAGITAAIELAERGSTVVLIESGTENYDAATQRLSDAKITTQGSHSVMDEAVRRGLGGTSALWGGRCVPLDTIDFESHDFTSCSGWPLDADDLAPYYLRACEILGVGEASFEVGICSALATHNIPLSSRFADTEVIRGTELERWSRAPNIWQAHKRKILEHPRITIQSGLTCIGFRQAYIDGPVAEALVQPTSAKQSEVCVIKARVFVVACGGVESTRLVLNSMRDPLGLKPHSPELVGRYYMGHPSGKIADIELFGKPEETLFGFERDGEVYVRRRITLRPETLLKEKLLNIAFWLDNPPLSDWRHGSGVLSASYLALTLPGLGRLLAPDAIRKRVAGEKGAQRMHHLLNCIRSPWQTLRFCVQFMRQRYFATPRLPGFFTFSSANHYALHYHAEHAPNWNSTITLSDESDAHGLLRAQIALEWAQQDIDSIIRAHEVLDKNLQDNDIGRLVYKISPELFDQSIREQAVDGFHQNGTLRMGADPSSGVTDSYGRMFGTSNLYIASSATFPTSGQANPTLAMIALTVRQAEKIANDLINE
jgi:choline dehydrogenase-like flavoprotein